MRAFKVGDKVTCETFGEGEVADIYPDRAKYYQVHVCFGGSQYPVAFDLDGWFYSDELESERIRHIDVPASPGSPDFIQELINAQGIKPITDPGFEEAAQKLAQKLAYALLNEDNVRTILRFWVVAERRPKQSRALWKRACTILVTRGPNIACFDEDSISIHVSTKKGGQTNDF